MHSYLRRLNRTDERGAVAIMVALALTAMLIGAAMVLDFGLVRVDRQVNKSAADAAASAGAHGLIVSGDAKSYTFRGVCSALQYLRTNDPRFSAATPTSGTWTRGDGTTAGNGCTDATIRNVTCVAGSTSTFARYVWEGAYRNDPIKVTIAGGYRLDTGSGQTQYSEEDLAAVAADNNDQAQGCFQLAVIVTQSRDPGLGSLATRSDLVTTVRSVGRIQVSPGGDAPAMLLLRRTGCPILQTGSNSGGSYIHVFGAVSSDGRTQAGTIHADSDGSSCSGGSNQNIFQGRATNGIVAYAAPLSAASPTTPDPAKPGVISSVASSLGITGGVIRDALANAHAATGVNETTPGTNVEPIGQGQVTRSLVDERYLGLGATPYGVKKAVTTAQGVFSSITSAATATGAGWKVIPNCDATAAQLTTLNLTAADSVYVDCTANSGYNGTRAINAGRVLFAGSVKPPNTVGNAVQLPFATKIYIVGDSAANGNAIDIGNNGALRAHTNGNTSAGTCTTSTVPDNKAIMVVKAGSLKQTGGQLQLCRTTVITMGGRADGCLPTSLGTAPNIAPCGGGTGNSQISLTGSAAIDWTAPNTMDITTDASGDPLPAAVTAWHDENGPEDLALWTESYGGTSSPTYSMGGSGVMHTVGVFMAPNAAPFTISGGSTQDLTNAQYIATSIDLNGTNTAIKMRVDPNSAVTMPKAEVVGLVR